VTENSTPVRPLLLHKSVAESLSGRSKTSTSLKNRLGEPSFVGERKTPKPEPERNDDGILEIPDSGEIDTHSRAFNDEDDNDLDFVDWDPLDGESEELILQSHAIQDQYQEVHDDSGDYPDCNGQYRDDALPEDARPRAVDVLPVNVPRDEYDECCQTYRSRVETVVLALMHASDKYAHKVSQKADLRREVFNFRFWVYARRLPPTQLVERLVAATPPVVRWLLGRRCIDSGLIRKNAPSISQKHSMKRGCYGNFAVHVTDRDADYTGSSGDLQARVKTHIREIKRPTASLEHTTCKDSVQGGPRRAPKHYRVLRDDG
jgi:hypothetical protein